MKNKAIFLDRDGTINVDTNYVHKIEEWKFIDGVKEALKKLQELGFKLIVISNQSGIGRGIFSKEENDILFKYMVSELEKDGIRIEKFYYCPHHNQNCECRKPKLGMFYEAAKEFDIDFSKSYAIRNKLRDVSICDKEPTRGFLLTKEKVELKNPRITICENLLEAAREVEKIEQESGGENIG